MSDTQAELRAIAERYGWELMYSEQKGLRYALTREGRTIEFSRSGRGYCYVTWDVFGKSTRVLSEQFTPGSPAYVSRETFAEAILSSYSDERFISSARNALSERVWEAEYALRTARAVLDKFDLSLRNMLVTKLADKEETNG